MLPAPQDICTTAHAKSALPASGFVNVLSIKPSTVTTAPLYNSLVSGQYFYPGAIFEYCDVTFAYSHTGRNNQFWLELWLLAPEKFQIVGCQLEVEYLRSTLTPVSPQDLPSIITI